MCPKKHCHSSPRLYCCRHFSGIFPFHSLKRPEEGEKPFKIDLETKHVKLGHGDPCVSYRSPFFKASTGEQETPSEHSRTFCCLPSRNQPESTRPRTWASAPSCSSWLDTFSMFSSTPVPPALRSTGDVSPASLHWQFVHQHEFMSIHLFVITFVRTFTPVQQQ